MYRNHFRAVELFHWIPLSNLFFLSECKYLINECTQPEPSNIIEIDFQSQNERAKGKKNEFQLNFHKNWSKK